MEINGKLSLVENSHITFYVLAMVGHLKNVSPTSAQMPDRIRNVEFITVRPTIANTMLAVVLFSRPLIYKKQKRYFTFLLQLCQF